jgi:hypothetical protein
VCLYCDRESSHILDKESVLLHVKTTIVLIHCSLQVKLRCGTENVVTSVSEPNRCEYVFEFVSPSICQSGEGTESRGHDEL